MRSWQSGRMWWEKPMNLNKVNSVTRNQVDQNILPECPKHETI